MSGTAALKGRVNAVRESLRELGRGLSPRYRPGTETLVIDELISPLRYDVLVRSHFFELLARRREVFDRDPPAFVELAREIDYYAWFTEVAVHAIGIAGRSTEDIDAAFHRRVLRSAALADSVAAKGFVAKPPLTIRASDGAVTSTGKRLGPRRYPLDGCHRLALLRQLGRRELRPGEYRVTSGTGSLLDNTAKLIPALGLDAGEYYPFVASGYVGGLVRNGDELRAAVRAQRGDRLAEVDSVVAADGALLLRS